MLLRYWTAIVFSLWVFTPTSTQQDSGSSSQCQIRADPDPQYVAAYLMHYQPGRGCYFNSSTPSHQLVHVINLKLPHADSNDQGQRRSVTLKIEPKDFSHGDKAGADGSGPDGPQKEQQKLMFVLNSQQPVKWKVEVSSKFPPESRQRFMVQSHSVIRFRKRKGRMQLRGRRRGMPSADDEHNFLSWVRRRFKAVTSYSEVDGDKLLFYVGQAEVSSPECRLNEMKKSPYAFIAHKNQQPVSGCISTGTKNVLDRPVYVIELMDVPDGGSESEQRVELDIMSANGKKMEHDFYLVLRSPPSLKWVLRTHRVYGWIDVVTNADADLRGIRMHTVALRRELMEESGVDLIHWTEYYVAPVRAYTSVSSANILQLLLPSADAKNSVDGWEPEAKVPKDHGPANPPQTGEKPSTDMREHLRHIIKTRCHGGMMEVAMPAVLTQARELDLPMEQLSLLDGNCRATKNSSHVIFRTALDQCRTKKITVDDEDVYSNAIVIHASGMVGAILEEELGSGYFDLQANSGSGWMEADGDDSGTTYVDDEDFASHKVEIDVECRLPKSNSLDSHRGLDASRRGGEERGVCDLQVYDDPLFLQRVVHFPHTASTTTGVYLQASSPHDPKQHVLMENCWVTHWPSPQHNDQHQTVLIQQGCTRSPSVRWMRYETGGADEETTPERLMIYQDLPHGSYVHCQLARCYKGSSSPGQKCPPDPSDHCNSNVLPNMFPQLQTHSCGIHTIGPIEITHTEINILEDTTRTTKSHHKEGSRQGQGEGHLPHSVIIEGLDSGTVVGIAFAAFAIGILLTGALWFIHTHTGPSKRGMSAVSMVGTSGDVTPNSSSPISA